MANLAAWLGDRQGHHPDIRFGWGYCEVAFTTHAAGGLTENDLICAARLNAITDDPITDDPPASRVQAAH